MADDDRSGPKRVAPVSERSIQTIVDRRIRALLDRKLHEFRTEVEGWLGEALDGFQGGGAGGGEGAGREELDGVIAEIARIGEALERVEAIYAKALPPFHWDDLEPEEREARWELLEDWVTTVLRKWLPRRARSLKWCWRQHPDAVYAVSAVWFAWHAGYRAPGRKGPEPLQWMKDLQWLVGELRAELGEPGDEDDYCETHGDAPTDDGGDP